VRVKYIRFTTKLMLVWFDKLTTSAFSFLCPFVLSLSKDTNGFHKKFIIILLFAFRTYSFCPLNRADLVVFSYDRPLQLYSFLESVKKYIFGIEEIHVIYRVSNNEFEAGYDIVKKDFANIIFHKQVKVDDFRLLTLESIFNSVSKYIIFGVDDIIVKDYVNLGTCINYLEKSNSYGFYLRMGKNIVECYMHFNESTPVPKMNQVSQNIFQWLFTDGKGDWKYPNNVDMTIYRKFDLKQLYNYNFQNPSALEAVWADNANYNQKGLCFKQSKIVNLPLNLVIDEDRNLDNRNSSLFSTKELLDKFMSGFKIDITKFYKINNLAPHAAIVPTFVPRTI